MKADEEDNGGARYMHFSTGVGACWMSVYDAMEKLMCDWCVDSL